MSSNVTQFFKYETQNLNIYWVRQIYNCSVGKRPKGQGWSLPPPNVYHPAVCIIQREQTINVNVRRKGRDIWSRALTEAFIRVFEILTCLVT